MAEVGSADAGSSEAGLTSDVKEVLKQALPKDLTIKVDKEEFRVHREVMSSVSDYFRAMFTQGMVESEKDVIELKDISHDTMSKLITLIYTGDLEVLNTDGQEILALAVYFQMLPVIEVCTQKLIDNLSVEKCLKLMEKFQEFALDDAVKSLHVFLRRNMSGVIEHHGKATISLELIKLFLDLWDGGEWDACLLVKDWVCGDYENRKLYINDLMSKVRFCLMSETKLKAVKEMEIYADAAGDSPWQELVQKAFEYQKLPIHLKVLDESEQSKVRGDPSPVIFTSGISEHPSTFFVLDEDKLWQQYEKKALNTPKFGRDFWSRLPITVVNNFLVACTCPEYNEWHIFDTRTLTWSPIAGIRIPKMTFALANHGEHVYCVGGVHTNFFGQDIPSFKTERYSLQTNTWTSIDAPTKFFGPATSVVGDNIYVCGNEEMWALDGVSLKWARKANPLEKHHRVTIHQLKFNEEDGLVIITPYWQINFYSIVYDQWSLVKFKLKLKYDCIDDGPDYMELTAGGNAVYRLNVIGRKDWGPKSIMPFNGPLYSPQSCLIWKFSEVGDDGVEEEVDEFPVISPDWTQRQIDPFGAMLIIPKDPSICPVPSPRFYTGRRV